MTTSRFLIDYLNHEGRKKNKMNINVAHFSVFWLMNTPETAQNELNVVHFSGIWLMNTAEIEKNEQIEHNSHLWN